MSLFEKWQLCEMMYVWIDFCQRFHNRFTDQNMKFSLSFSLSRTHARRHAHARMHTHTFLFTILTKSEKYCFVSLITWFFYFLCTNGTFTGTVQVAGRHHHMGPLPLAPSLRKSSSSPPQRGWIGAPDSGLYIHRALIKAFQEYPGRGHLPVSGLAANTLEGD